MIIQLIGEPAVLVIIYVIRREVVLRSDGFKVEYNPNAHLIPEK